MGRIGETDLPDRLAPGGRGTWIVQLVFALFVTAAAIALRAVIDSIAPAAGPFSLGFPAILVATLFGRWQAGLITGVLTLTYSWYFVLPVPNSFLTKSADDTGRLILAGLNYAAVLVIAELFRGAARRATAERDRELAERDLFLEEFDHRVKNNFALVVALLDLQRRRAKESETRDALASALSRVESIARAHRHLYRGGASPGEIDMAAYLHELCAALSEALLLRGTIRLDCAADHATLPRDRAVSIGLIVNELVTNAAKHAFAGRESGRIAVRFEAAVPGLLLVVSDNGVGMPATPRARGKEGGLGQKLVDGFVRQARGNAEIESSKAGTIVRVTLEP